MQLTAVLLRFTKRLPKGHIFRGKYRIVKAVTPLDTANKRHAFEIEEKNMFYLRHPYLTEEECYGHTIPFKNRYKFIQKHKEEKLKKYEDVKLLGDRFGFLKVADKWE